MSGTSEAGCLLVKSNNQLVNGSSQGIKLVGWYINVRTINLGAQMELLLMLYFLAISCLSC